MAFTLSIHFSGLCLFVPERATATTPDRMHVLLPTAQDPAHYHVPVLQWDASHLLNPQTTTPAPKPSRVMSAVPIRGGDMHLSGGSGANLSMCPEIVSVRSVAGRPVLPGLLTGSPGGLLASRITLTAGAMVAVSPGACWTWVYGARRCMAHNAWWEMPITGAEIQLPLTPLAGGPQVPTVPILYPMGPEGDQRVNVSVLHLPREELGFEPPPATPPPGGVAHHFSAYYPLFGVTPAPLLPRDPREEECGPTGCDHREWMGPSAFNCMLGGG